MSLRKVFWQALVGLVCLLFSVSALAQSTGGRILGRVTDPTGAVVSGAKVTLTNDATGASRTVETDSSGDYTLVQVPVGKYTVTVEHANFKTNVRKGVTVELNQALNLDAVLQVGARTDVVEVTGEAPLVDTTSTQLGAVVNERAVTGLPLNSRDTYQLLSLQPGVQSTVGQDLFFGSDKAGVVSVNGGRLRSNNFTVNGGDGNDLFVNAPAIQPTPDAIEEFRVLTNTFDAEYGRNSGSVVNVVTKSGTNKWHGSLFEFLRDDSLNAKGYFEPEKANFHQHQFGATLGGPIKKDRTFFFVSYEGRRSRRPPPTDLVTVPSLAERTGDFSAGTPFFGVITDQTVADILNDRCGLGAAAGSDYATLFPGNIIPTACMDPVAADLLGQFVPQPNVGLDGFVSVPLLNDRTDQFTARLDHRFNENHQLGIYYYFSDTTLFEPFSKFQAGGANLPNFGQNSLTRTQQWNVSHTWVINPNTVNEFRFTYLRASQGTLFHPERTHLVTDSCATAGAFCFTGTSESATVNGITGASPSAGITPALGPDREGVPFIDVGGAFAIGNNFEGELPQTGNSFTWADSFSKVWGKHSLKFGGDVRRQRFDQFLYFDVNGSYSYFGGGPNDVGFFPFGSANPDPALAFESVLPNYLLGLPDFYLQGSAQREHVRVTSLYLFAQDSWKVKPNLTLNYGLRWEFNTPLTDVGQRVQTFRPEQETQIYPCVLSNATQIALYGTTDCSPSGLAAAVFPLGLVVPGDTDVPGGLTQTYYRAFAPRVGLAWSPGAKDGWLAKLTGGPGKTSIRMGWGMFYNPVEQLVLEQFSAEPPFGGSSGIANSLFNTPFVRQDGTVLPNPFNGVLDPPRNQPVDWSVFRPILLYGQAQPDMRPQYSAQYNLTIQRELAKDWLLQISYVGSQGHRLLATYDLNFGNPQTCIDLADMAVLNANPDLDCGAYFADSAYLIPAGSVTPPQGLTLPYGSVPSIPGGATLATPITLVGLRQFSSPSCEPTTGANCPLDGVPVFSNIFAQDTVAHSNYHSLQLFLQKRFSRGFQFTGAYTWSKSIDNASSFESILNPNDFSTTRSLSLFHAKHRATFTYIWELPIPKKDGFAGKLVNGWSISGITQFQSGFPIRILSEDDQELMLSFDFELPGRPDQIGPFRTLTPQDNDNQYFDPSAFTTAAFGTLGTAPRSICCGPGIHNWDVSFLKDTRLGERASLQFRAEFFNLWNHTQFHNPDGNITNGDEFGRVKRARDPRLVQFALKLSW